MKIAGELGDDSACAQDLFDLLFITIYFIFVKFKFLTEGWSINSLRIKPKWLARSLAQVNEIAQVTCLNDSKLTCSSDWSCKRDLPEWLAQVTLPRDWCCASDLPKWLRLPEWYAQVTCASDWSWPENKNGKISF